MFHMGELCFMLVDYIQHGYFIFQWLHYVSHECILFLVGSLCSTLGHYISHVSIIFHMGTLCFTWGALGFLHGYTMCQWVIVFHIAALYSMCVHQFPLGYSMFHIGAIFCTWAHFVSHEYINLILCFTWRHYVSLGGIMFHMGPCNSTQVHYVSHWCITFHTGMLYFIRCIMFWLHYVYHGCIMFHIRALFHTNVLWVHFISMCALCFTWYLYVLICISTQLQ